MCMDNGSMHVLDRSAGCRDTWGVEAIGQLGMGNASNYAPIVEYVKNALPLADALSKWGF